MIRIGIAEDQALFRRGIIGLLNSFAKMNVVEEAENGQLLLDKYDEIIGFNENIPDITILDLNMPVLDGIKTTELLKKRFPESKIIIISSFDYQDIIVYLYEKGANAYLDKNAKPKEVETAINSVFEKEFYFNAAAKKALEDSSSKGSAQIRFNNADKLTDSEFEVLLNLCHEKTTLEIADLMNVSTRTVEGHKYKLLQKTKAKNTTGLDLFALKANFINISEIKINLF